MTIHTNPKTLTQDDGFVLANGPSSFLLPIDPTAAPTSPAANSASGSGLNLPFQNLDPYDTEGKDGLPQGTLEAGPGGGIDVQVGVAGGAGATQVSLDLAMTDHVFSSSSGRVEILELFDTRSTEIATVSFNGQTVPVEYQSSTAFGFSGKSYDETNRAMFVQMEAETVEAFQAEAFDRDGYPILTSYAYEQLLSVEGQAFDYGIAEFAMAFEISFELVLNEFGFYTMTMSVLFEGEIVGLDGMERLYSFEDHKEFFFSNLDQVSFDQLPSGLMFEIEKFASGMDDAWGGLDVLNDQLEAALLQLRDQGHYERWDEADQGLANPFDFDLPSVDLWG